MQNGRDTDIISGNKLKQKIMKKITCMKVLYYLLPINGKPEWLSMADILNYEKQMKSSI